MMRTGYHGVIKQFLVALVLAFVSIGILLFLKPHKQKPLTAAFDTGAPPAQHSAPKPSTVSAEVIPQKIHTLRDENPNTAQVRHKQATLKPEILKLAFTWPSFEGASLAGYLEELEKLEQTVYADSLDFRLQKLHAWVNVGKLEEARSTLEGQFENWLEDSSEFESCKLTYLVHQLDLNPNALKQSAEKCFSTQTLGGSELEFQSQLAEIVSVRLSESCDQDCMGETAKRILQNLEESK